MKEAFETFFGEMACDVPAYIYAILLILFCLFSIIAMTLCGLKKGFRLSLRLALVEYIFLIYCATVFYRPSNNNVEHHFTPFWSYAAYDNVERPDLLPENIMNVVMFIPLGFLLGVGFIQKKWWKVFLAGFCISLSIETFQYFFKLGVSEFDDVMHNTIGCALGYGTLGLIFLCKERL